MTKTGLLLAIIATLILLLLASSTLGIIAFTRTTGFGGRNCREIEVVKTGLRETLQQSERQFETSKVRTPAEKAAAKAFYTAQLAHFAPRSC